jgi:hypothetical protein
VDVPAERCAAAVVKRLTVGVERDVLAGHELFVVVLMSIVSRIAAERMFPSRGASAPPLGAEHVLASFALGGD